MKVKICGLSKLSHVKACVDNGADFCGFILNYPKSHRYISFNKADKITKFNKKKTKFVGVLVNPTNDEFQKYSKLNIDYFQIYGNFSKKKLSDIKKKYKKKIIYTIQVKKKKDIIKYKFFKNSADLILFDSSGFEKSISWNFNWIKNIPLTKMIAGNINIDKIDIISRFADIIDVSGALETNKVKDINKIKIFLKKIKQIKNEA
tara:strand:+ start:423 stop:1034 length:612 start_codon:yes stop_codon:yes gene_type:complete